MKKRNTILILGITSIIILISVQVYIIKGIWAQKDEMFGFNYSMRSAEAMNYIRRELPSDGFDTVTFLLGNYAEKANRELHAIDDEKKLDEMKSNVIEYFTKVVNSQQYLSDLLSAYFEWRGYEKDFSFSIVVNNLEMIESDTIVVYRDINYTPSRRFSDRGPRQGFQDRDRNGNKILVNRFSFEDNNYRFSFNYFIDFSDKQKVILKETSASLIMSGVSIIVVVMIFIVAYRNLMEEKRLSNLKTDFINNMTHELKTPLSTITVAGRTLEMVQIRTNEEKILETAKLIGKQSVHLNQLINMILEISMWERTEFQLDKKTVYIEDIMKDIVFSFKSGGGNGTDIKELYDFKETKVDLDVVYFTTMINNLLSNAVKYCEKDPVVEIGGSVIENYITINIADNGIGISKSDQKHIFDKFYRASGGNIHKFKGLGLGLYYVKKIAEAHQGDVLVTSKPGKGSIFTVTIPILI